MSDIYVLIGQGLLTLLSCFVCYLLGKRKVSNEREKERADAVSLANKIRIDLSNRGDISPESDRYNRDNKDVKK